MGVEKMETPISLPSRNSTLKLEISCRNIIGEVHEKSEQRCLILVTHSIGLGLNFQSGCSKLTDSANETPWFYGTPTIPSRIVQISHLGLQTCYTPLEEPSCSVGIHSSEPTQASGGELA